MRDFDGIDEARMHLALAKHNDTGWSVSTEDGYPLCGYVPNENPRPIPFILKNEYFNPFIKEYNV